MRKLILILLFAPLIWSGPALARRPEIVISSTFSEGSDGWLAGFSDYTLRIGDLQRLAELRPLPPEIGDPHRGYFIQGMNRSDDLFMFIKREINYRDGLKPNTRYEMVLDIQFASNAPSGCSGVGGAPGESVYLKAGISPVEPVTMLSGVYIHLNLDKGEQSIGGTDAGVVSDIANGRPCGDGTPPYVLLTRRYRHPNPVRTDEQGDLWLMVGTDSGYEGLTGLYYTSITATLTEV